MRNAQTMTALIALTLMTGTAAFAASSTAPQRQAPAQTQPGTPQAPSRQVAYYKGNPLSGGQLLKTVTVTAGPGTSLTQNAPQGATYAVITTPRGQEIINLQAAQVRPQDQGQAAPTPGRGAPDGPARPDARPGAAPQGTGGPVPGTRPSAPAGPAMGANAAPRDDAGSLGRMLRGATSVTFYTADPLKGGQATQTIRLTDPAAQQAALTQAAKTAKFAVVERGGERVIVDLSSTPPAPDRAGDAGPPAPVRR